MAGMTRTEIIALAVKWAGRKAQNVDLREHYDYVLQDMSRRYALLREKKTGTLTADENYLALPADYRSQVLIEWRGYQTAFKVSGNWLPWLKNPGEFYDYDQTYYGSVPVLYTVFEEANDRKIRFYPKTQTETPAYEFHYFKIHETSGNDKNYRHDYGELWDMVVVNGVASRAGAAIGEDKVELKYEAKYLRELTRMFSLTTPGRYARVKYHHF